jgi:phage repressor protein C with HTH and peptisase S24 domain
MNAQQTIHRIQQVLATDTIKDLAHILNIPQTTIRNWLHRDSIPYSVCTQLAQTHHISLDWLVLGKGTPAIAQTDDEFVYINKYDVQAAAGYGAWHDREHIKSRLSFRREQLRSMGLQPKNLAILDVKGDSMEPVLANGVQVMIDFSKNQLISDSIYVVGIDNALFIKRLQQILSCENNQVATKVRVISENPAYDAFEINLSQAGESFLIIGQVVWSDKQWISAA